MQHTKRLISQDFIFPTDFEIYNLKITYENLKDVTLEIHAEKVKLLKNETILIDVLFVEKKKDEIINIQNNDFSLPVGCILDRSNFLQSLFKNCKPLRYFSDMITGEQRDPEKGCNQAFKSPPLSKTQVLKFTKKRYKKNVAS